jgi:hypothetical protein
MSTDSAIKRFTRSQVSDDGGKKKPKRHRPQQLTPIEAMMSTKYKEWRARGEKLKREVELLTQEADHIHEKLVERWNLGDPAFELVRHDREVNVKLDDALSRLARNTLAGPPKEDTCSDLT